MTRLEAFGYKGWSVNLSNKLLGLKHISYKVGYFMESYIEESLKPSI